VAELDSTDAVVARHVYATRGHAPDLMQTPGAECRLVLDHLGSVRMVVDTQTGEVERRREWTAWGEAAYDSGGVAVGLGYAGGLADPATGLVRYGARVYDPDVGRWTTLEGDADFALRTSGWSVPSPR
jgi:RHS repeat-associated protein